MVTCALGFFASTGRAVAVAVAPGPELVGKWGMLLTPPGQERFVYHAALEFDVDPEEWVRTSMENIGRATQDAVDGVLAELDGAPIGAAIVGKTIEMDLPVADILASHTRLHTAEGVLYRSAIADALHARKVDTTLIAPDELGDRSALDRFGKVPAPWRKEHKEAALAAAVLVSRGRASGRAPATRTAPGAPRGRKA